MANAGLVDASQLRDAAVFGSEAFKLQSVAVCTQAQAENLSCQHQELFRRPCLQPQRSLAKAVVPLRAWHGLLCRRRRWRPFGATGLPPILMRFR